MGQDCSLCQCCEESKDNLLGMMVKNVLMSYDENMLGVNVHVGGLQINPHLMEINISDLKLDNPPGGFRSEHLVVADKVRINLDAASLLSSRGQQATVEELIFEGVNFTYEPRVGSSNVRELLRQLQREKSAAEAKAEEKKQKIQLTLLEVRVNSVNAKVYIRGFGPQMSVANIHYKDFNKEFKGVSAFLDIIRILLTTLLKSVLSTATSNVKQVGKAAVSGVSAAGSLAVSGVTSGVSALSRMTSGLRGNRTEQSGSESEGITPRS
mmetsp:Transcript_5764/g.13567  ORF Transcript_5764/g.13567 Transcript_5764/m.13567 type:complete len:267 (+) Transcript_5764:67-867(+)